MGCQVDIAKTIVTHKAEFLLALKGNQPNLEPEVADYFRDAPDTELVAKTTVEKGHGRIETRTYVASSKVDWINSERSYPGQTRFTGIKTLVKVDSRVEHADRSTSETRYFICSAPLGIERIAQATRGHWGVESMQWLLDVEFGDDLSRYRPVTAPKIWPSSAASPSILSAPTRPKGASRHDERKQAGAPLSCSKFFSHVTLTWIPCREVVCKSKR